MVKYVIIHNRKDVYLMPRKTVLVTGASRGIGKAVAVKFAKKGYNVAISCVRREEQLMRTQKEIESFQVPCLAYKGDMGDMACCKELFLKIKKMFGGVDVLVNNAGISYIGLLQDMSTEDWERKLRTNLTSVFNCCKLAVPYMIYPRIPMQKASALTKALAKELAPSNIQVNAIACGAIDTEMNQWMDEDDLIALVDEIPSGRLGRAEEVADLVYHLGYKESYLTGQVIGLDGGWI